MPPLKGTSHTHTVYRNTLMWCVDKESRTQETHKCGKSKPVGREKKQSATKSISASRAEPLPRPPHHCPLLSHGKKNKNKKKTCREQAQQDGQRVGTPAMGADHHVPGAPRYPPPPAPLLPNRRPCCARRPASAALTDVDFPKAEGVRLIRCARGEERGGRGSTPALGYCCRSIRCCCRTVGACL